MTKLESVMEVNVVHEIRLDYNKDCLKPETIHSLQLICLGPVVHG